MSEAAEAGSLAHRLGAGRLSNPGVLDRRVLQRAHDRLAPSTKAHLLGRLQRRVTPATPGTESLPLVRIDRSVDVDAAPLGFPSKGATPDVAAAQSRIAPVTEASSTAPVIGSRNARSWPTIARTPAIVARRVAQA